MRTLSLTTLLSFVVACGDDGSTTDTTTTDTTDAPEPTDTTDTTDTTEPLVDCDSPGQICTVVGQPGSAQFSAVGIPASEGSLYLVQDVSFGPDGTMYILDFNNHRILKVGGDGILRLVTGTGMLGDGPEGSAFNAAWNHPTNMAFNPLEPNVLYVAAWHNSRINAIDLVANTLDWRVGTGGRIYTDGVDQAVAGLDLPAGIVFDEDGTLYIMDQANQVIREVGADGIIHTIAGTAPTVVAGVTTARFAGYAGDGGAAIGARFHASVGQAADPSSRMELKDGLLYVVDTDNHMVRYVDLAASTVDRFAGTYVENPADSTPGDWSIDNLPALGGYAGDGGPALDAQLNGPRDIAFGLDGELYIADTLNNCVRVVDTAGNIDTFAGTCDALLPGSDGEGVPATDALLHKPYGVTVDPATGDVYISDTYNHTIRRVAH